MLAFARARALSQARAVWQWWNYLEGSVASSKRALRINMDETSISLDQGDVRGVIFCSKQRRRGGQAPVRRIGRAKRRTCLTHIAFICDEPEIQARLPQIVVGNLATFLVRDWAAIVDGEPANFYVVRQASAWNNAALLCRVIHVLGRILEPYLANWQPILLFDACRIHLAPSVWLACRAARIWPIVVPPRLTGALQPLDTHAFCGFKRALRQCHQNKQLRGATPNLGIISFLECLYEAAQLSLVSKRWATAFDEDGFGMRQAAVSRHARRELGFREGVGLGAPAGEPTEATLRLCFPRRMRAPVGGVAALVRRSLTDLTPRPPLALPPPPPLAPEAAAGSGGASSSSGVGPIAARTRAATKALASAAAGSHRSALV